MAVQVPQPYYRDVKRDIVLYTGKCEDILPSLPDKSVDHLISDPPYEMEAHTLQRRVKRGRSIDGDMLHEEVIPFDPMTEELREFISKEAVRLAKRWILTFCQIEGAPKWRESYERAGAKYKRTCIWVKPDGLPQLSGDRPAMGYEAILAMHAPCEGKSKWNGGGRSGVFIHNKNEGTTPNLHPTQKPLRLMNELVLLFTDENDLILDPFAGSGSTLVSAKVNGRRAIGIEMEEKYCEIAVKRLSQELLF